MAIPTEPTLSTRIRTLSRGAGRNAPQFSAYISGTEIDLERPGQEPEKFDYSRRAWNVEHAELVTPDDAPEWARDRQTLWNRVEATERRKDSQVARDLRFSFSYDLTAEQRRDLAREIASGFASDGMCADVAVHRYGQKWDACDPKTADQVGKWQSWGIPFVDADKAAALNSEHIRVTLKRDGTVRDYRLFQPHCHVLLTMRPIKADGSGFEGKTEGRDEAGNVVKSKARLWNDQKFFEPLRGEIAARQNAMLAANGSDRRIDARGYEVRRAEALDLAAEAKASGRAEEAARQTLRAEQLRRDPEPYLGVAQRVKVFTERMRDRFSQWVAVRHRNRLQPEIDALWNRDHVSFVTNAHRLLQMARKSVGLEPEPDELVLATAHGRRDEGLEL